MDYGVELPQCESQMIWNAIEYVFLNEWIQIVLLTVFMGSALLVGDKGNR